MTVRGYCYRLRTCCNNHQQSR